MPVWPNSKMITVYYDGTEMGEYPCEVRIDENEIVVSYKEDNMHVLYKGKSNGIGHYYLTCSEQNGEASLHRFPDAVILDGHWLEGVYKGFWRIYLGK